MKRKQLRPNQGSVASHLSLHGVSHQGGEGYPRALASVSVAVLAGLQDAKAELV